MKDKQKLIAATLLSIVGIVGVFATLISMPQEYATLKTILIIFCSLIILLALLFYASYYIDFSNMLSILKSVKKIGIKSINENGIGSQEMKVRLINAKTIKIISTSGLVFFRTCEEEIITALKNNARVSIILSSQNTQFTKETEEIEGRSLGEIDNELKQVDNILKRFLSEANKSTNNQTTGVINIKHFNTHLRLPMIIIDDKYLWVTLTLPPKRSTQSHSIEIAKSSGSNLLSDCIKHFDELWANLSSPNAVKKISFNDFFNGVWKLEYFDGKVKGMEYFKIEKNKYYMLKNENNKAVADHYFDIDQIEFNYEAKSITFRKVAIKPNDDRKLVNVLTIDNDNKLKGKENGYIEMTYYRN
jgi:hypothetical protein